MGRTQPAMFWPRLKMKGPGLISLTETGEIVSVMRTGSEGWATIGTVGGAISRAGSQSFAGNLGASQPVRSRRAS